ncbi:hypothetical protein F5Y16DRAFT_370616 [Xylariaceae sp. FL0255]|nr:hypothetical protein F5Y16DRAFT_370616 [Xylariaceae sp. FL0255]
MNSSHEPPVRRQDTQLDFRSPSRMPCGGGGGRVLVKAGGQAFLSLVHIMQNATVNRHGSGNCQTLIPFHFLRSHLPHLSVCHFPSFPSIEYCCFGSFLAHIGQCSPVKIPCVRVLDGIFHDEKRITRSKDIGVPAECFGGALGREQRDSPGAWHSLVHKNRDWKCDCVYLPTSLPAMHRMPVTFITQNTGCLECLPGFDYPVRAEM